MPIDPLFGVVTFAGDTNELIVGVAERLKYLFRYRITPLALTAARVFDVHFILHGAILA